jgi:tartrate dehydrogenase/decarboxylase/D-malate dehydrogenase
MKTYRIALHPRRRHRQGSDARRPAGAAGAGRARRRFAFDFPDLRLGRRLVPRHGEMMPADGLDALRGKDAILFGSAGDPHIPDHITLWGLRLKICQGFDQYANVRPTRILPGIDAPAEALRPATWTG